VSSPIPQPPSPAQGFAPINGARLYFENGSVGSPVVVVHAALLAHRMWQPQLGVFADQFRVIASDARAYGRSILPSVAYSNALVLRNLLRYLGAAPATIVGCSLGATIALDLAIEYPESVTALVLVNGALNGYITAPDPYA